MRRSCAFTSPSTTKLEHRTQLAGIAQYSRVGHTKRFLPSYIPRQAALDQSRTPHGGRYRSANGNAPHAQSRGRVRTRWDRVHTCAIRSQHGVFNVGASGWLSSQLRSFIHSLCVSLCLLLIGRMSGPCHTLYGFFLLRAVDSRKCMMELMWQDQMRRAIMIREHS